MWKTTVLGTTTLAVVGLLSLSGCESRKDALAFNQAIVGANKKLETAGTELGLAIGHAVNGGPQDLATAKEKHANAVQVVQQVKTDMQTLKVPSSKSAQTLYEAHQKFLQGEERMIQSDFAEILKTLDDPALTKTAKTNKAQAIFKRVEQAEQQDLIPLQNAQKEFAKENNLILSPNP